MKSEQDRVLEAVKRGHTKVPDIAGYAKVSENNTRTYLTRLMDAGKVIKEPAKYVAAKSTPYPFCRHKAKCAGLTSCPRDPTCAD